MDYVCSMNTGTTYYNTGHDGILDVKYLLKCDLASIVSEQLKSTLKELNIDEKAFNSEAESIKSSWLGNDEESIASPPAEIYEYQNFFLMERKSDGKTILLDGFRRLLWYNVPQGVAINYRVYKQADMTDKQVLQLLVSLNHTKFFSGIGDYFDRGFSLALNLCFGLEILQYKTAFDAYLSNDKIERDYSSQRDYRRQKYANIVKERIMSDNFIADMHFIQALPDYIMRNNSFGALLWKIRTENKDFVFDAKTFTEKCKNNKHLPELHKKYEKSGNGGGAEAIKIINRIIEQYNLIFNEMIGNEVRESYLDAKARTKKIADTLKKDRKWMRVTKESDTKRALWELVKSNGDKSPKVKIVAHPVEATYKINGKTSMLSVGLHEDFVLTIVNAYKTFGAAKIYPSFKKPNTTIYVDNGLDKVDSDWDTRHKYCHNDVEVFVSLDEFTDIDCKRVINDK